MMRALHLCEVRCKGWRWRREGPAGCSDLWLSDICRLWWCRRQLQPHIMWDYLLHNKLTGYREHTGDLHSINQYQVRNVYTSDSHCIQEKKYIKKKHVCQFLFYILHGKIHFFYFFLVNKTIPDTKSISECYVPFLTIRKKTNI